MIKERVRDKNESKNERIEQLRWNESENDLKGLVNELVYVLQGIEGKWVGLEGPKPTL